MMSALTAEALSIWSELVELRSSGLPIPSDMIRGVADLILTSLTVQHHMSQRSEYMPESTIKPIPPEKLLKMVPSSRANPPRVSVAPEEHRYLLSVQRKDRSGRFREVASWTVTTTEPDMQGPLQMGLRDNYRILITDDNRRTTGEATVSDQGSGDGAVPVSTGSDERREDDLRTGRDSGDSDESPSSERT